MKNSRVIILYLHPMKKFLLWFSVILGIILVLYNLWAYSNRAKEKKTGWVDFPPAGKIRFQESVIGKNTGKGNILAIQPYFTPQSYSTAFNFLVTLKLYLRQAKKDSLLNRNTVVAFPEHTGTWLFTSREKESIYNKKTISAASNTLFFSNFFSLLPLYFSANSEYSRAGTAIFGLKSSSMAEIYYNTFASLAKEYGVTIIAGSIILSEPYIDDTGALKTKKGKLYNTIAIFGKDGRIIGPLLKERPPEIFSGKAIDTVERSTTGLYSITGGDIAISLSDDIPPDTKMQRPSAIIFPSFSHTQECEQKILAHLNSMLRDSTANNMIRFNFSGDMWDRSSDGNLLAAADNPAGNDSILILGPSLRRGRIVNYWLH
jgi:hypothetical protein